MELQTLIQNCLLFSKRTVTHSDNSCTNLIKVECPLKYDTVRHGRTKEGIRVAIGPGAENLYFDKISKDLIIKNIQIHTREKLKKLFRKYHLRKQDSAFRLWREKSVKKLVQPIVIQKNEIIIKRTITNSAWTLNIIKSKRNSIAIIITVYLQHCNNCVEKKFRSWKNYTRSRKYMMIKFFDKWSIKTSRILLNKMNMIRFIQILKNRIVHYQRKKLLPRWKQFKRNCEFLKTMAHVKLLFICWKTTTIAMKEGRGRRLKYFFQFWRGQVTFQKDDNEENCASMILLQKKRIYKNWTKKIKSRQILKKIFSLRFTNCCGAWKKLIENMLEKKIDDYRICDEVIMPSYVEKNDNDENQDKSFLSCSISSPNRLVQHTPSRCRVRKCLICSRKSIPVSSPEGSVYRSTVDGSFLRSSINGILLKTSPQKKEKCSENSIIDDENSSFTRFRSEFPLKKGTVRDSFLLIGSYAAIDVIPELEEGSLFNASGTFLEFDKIFKEGENICKMDKIESKAKIPVKRKSSNISFNFGKKMNSNDNEKTKKEFLSEKNMKKNMKNKNSIEEEDQKFNENILKIPHVSFSPNRYDNKNIIKNENERKREKIPLSRIEENFMRRLNIVQKLDNDFVIRKYSIVDQS